VRCAHGEGDLAEVVRALDAEGLRVAHLQLHAPSLDDVFLAKTGRSLEGAGERPGAEEASEEQRAREALSA
jgi:ABC-2 type transport system ATP-binding protein